MNSKAEISIEEARSFLVKDTYTSMIMNQKEEL